MNKTVFTYKDYGKVVGEYIPPSENFDAGFWRFDYDKSRITVFVWPEGKATVTYNKDVAENHTNYYGNIEIYDFSINQTQDIFYEALRIIEQGVTEIDKDLVDDEFKVLSGNAKEMAGVLLHDLKQRGLHSLLHWIGVTPDFPTLINACAAFLVVLRSAEISKMEHSEYPEDTNYYQEWKQYEKEFREQ